MSASPLRQARQQPAPSDACISGRGGDRLDRDHVRTVTLQHRPRDLDLLLDEGEQARVLRIGRLRARQHVDLAVVAEDRERHPRFGAGRGARDRKSTRLNSSHLVISYAVFCLKKKKKKERTLIQTNTNSRNHYKK